MDYWMDAQIQSLCPMTVSVAAKRHKTITNGHNDNKETQNDLKVTYDDFK